MYMVEVSSPSQNYPDVQDLVETYTESKPRPAESIRRLEADVYREVPHYCSVLPSGPLCYLREACIRPLPEITFGHRDNIAQDNTFEFIR